MTGFLGQLAALTLHRVEALPPRLPSRFEDSPGGRPVDFDERPPEPEFETIANEKMPPASPIGLMGEIRPAPSLPADSSRAARDDQRDRDLPFAKPTGPQPIVSQSSAPNEQAPQAASHITAKPDTFYQSATPIWPEPVVSEIVEQVTRIERQITEQTRHETVVHHDVVQPASIPTRALLHSEPPVPQQRMRGELQVPDALTSSTQTRRQATLPSHDAGLKQTPAATIQVTIGRIEIRATQTSEKAAAKPRQTAPALSLEDYLKQRNGGRS